MSKVTYDLVAYTTSVYQKDGVDKRVSVNIGNAYKGEKDGKPYFFISLKSHINLAALHREQGKDTITVSIFEKKDAEEKAQYNSYVRKETIPEASDEIPF